MKIVKWLAIGVGALIVLFLIIGMMLPGQVHVERSIAMKAPAARIFPLVNSFDHFKEWSPWAMRDPNTKYQFNGPKEGVGCEMVWTSDNSEVGNGSQKIIESTPPTHVKTSLDFGMNGAAFATFDLTEQGDSTKVVWGLDSEMSGPVARWFGLAMDGMIGPDYEQGLASLKKLAESLPAEEAVADAGDTGDGDAADAGAGPAGDAPAQDAADATP